MHVRGEGVEDQRTTGRIAHHRNKRAQMVLEQVRHGAGVFAFHRLLRLCFMQSAAQQHGHHSSHGTKHKRNTPAPSPQLVFGQHGFQNNNQQHRQQLATNQGDILERREEPALAFECDLAHVGGGGAIFAPDRQSLKQAAHQQQKRCPSANLRIGWQTGDDQRAKAHHHHRNQHRFFAAVFIGNTPKQPTTNRSHQKAGGKHPCSVEQLYGGVPFGEEGRCKIDGRERVDIKVKPLHQIA